MQNATTLPVAEIPTEHLRYIESVLGCHLQPSQRLVFLSYTPGMVPDEVIQRTAMDRLQRLGQKVAEYQAAHGITAQEVDEAVDEAIEQVRQRRSNN